ncbi:MAG: carboxymuconolactone decarboxylase family protein [Acidimicrobiales bacterium]
MNEPHPGGTAADEGRGGASARARGMAKMQEVYGFSVDPDEIPVPYVAFTVDHLFGQVWTRPELGIRDRRLMTIGVLAALGQSPLVEIQFQSALDRGELSEDQVRETVVHLTHYIGWPLSTGVNEVAERVIARRHREEGQRNEDREGGQ